MADQHHLEMIKKGVEALNSWRAGRQSVLLLDLSDSELQGLNLQGADLKGAYLKGANLREANLQTADLTNAILEGVDLQGANLNGAECSQVNLEGANLSRAKLGNINLTNANLLRANVEETHLIGAKLMGSNLCEATLHLAKLIGANLQGALLVASDLRGADLTGANLEHAILIEANLENCILEGARLYGAMIHQEGFSLLPNDIREVQGNAIRVVGSRLKGTIIRSIEFPPEYHEAGVSILNYFGTVLRQKYPEKKVKVRIEQDGLKVTMIVETEEGDREAIERTLDEYGRVVLNQIPAIKLLEDPLQAMALEHKLEMANMEIRQAHEMLGFVKGQYEKRIVALEEDQRWFRQHVSGLLLHSGDLVSLAKDALRRDQGFLGGMAVQTESIRHEVSTLSNRLDTLRGCPRGH